MQHLKLTLIFSLLLPVITIAQNPKDMECDFEDGAKGWSGDGKIVDEEFGNRNRVYSLKKTASKNPELTHSFTVPKNGTVTLNLRVRVMEGAKGVRVRKAMRRERGAGFAGVTLGQEGEWVYITHAKADRTGEGPFKCTAAFVFREGKGEVQFDDITVTVENGDDPSGGTDSDMDDEDDPSMTNGEVTGNEHAPDIPLKLSQTKVNGLLVLSLANNEHAGAASPMTLSALRDDAAAPSTVKFNQKVGSMMSKALAEVVKFIELRHDAWPKGRTMEISFENKYNPKDGPSAAVACALLLESAISGNELDPAFAVTGDMNADGSVQPVGGIDAKIRGADNRDCTHVAIPSQNTTSVYDSVLMEGVKPIVDIQVFSISNFDEAEALAQKERPAEVQKSIDNFKKITGVYQKAPQNFGRTIRHPKVISLLEEILKATPNHLSAKILLDHAKNKASKTLSLHGSTEFIENKAYSITDVIDDSGQVSQLEALSNNQVVEAINLLRRSRDRLDQRTWRWANGLIEFGTLLNQLQTSPPSTLKMRNKLVNEINAAGRSVRSERKALFQNPEVMEELLQ